jgi:hypothetical protein
MSWDVTSTTKGHVYSGRAKIIIVPLGALAIALDVRASAGALLTYHASPWTLVKIADEVWVVDMCFRRSRIAIFERHVADS